MSATILDTVERNIRYIPVGKLRIEADTFDREKVEKILGDFKCDSVELLCKEHIPQFREKHLKEICIGRGMDFRILPKRPESIDQLKVEILNFFYSHHYNPCLGHKVGIDTCGEIKTCLWSEAIIGNIRDGCLTEIIRSGCFDPYWELTKDKISTCKECEKRYACNDCRVSVESTQNAFPGKSLFCNYDPHNPAVK
ncbi:MAG: hypothetical protein GY765_01515 [bacterium]|nr:hypothetical protein [bacterium]